MNQIIYTTMLSQIQKEIFENKNTLLNMEKLDNKYCNIKINLENFFKIIEYYKSKTIKENNNKLYFYCNGNPYIVLNIAMLSILYNNIVEINIDDTMLGTNKVLLEIINKVLENNNLKNKISLFTEIPESAIFIDRINDYTLLKKEMKNAKFIPYYGLEVYLENSKYENLFNTIYSYSLDNNIDIDLFEDEGLDIFFKYGKEKRKLILTDKKEIIEKYKNENVFINENPFKNELLIFDDEIINKLQ